LPEMQHYAERYTDSFPSLFSSYLASLVFHQKQHKQILERKIFGSFKHLRLY